MTLSPRSVKHVTLLQTLALVPPVVVAVTGSPGDALLLTVAVLTAIIWELLFAGIRRHAFSVHGITTALIVTLFCPIDIALWQLAFCVSLGVVFGELIFGGRGFGFVSAAALTLSLIIVSFPDLTLRGPTPELAVLVIPGLVLLVVAGLVSLAVVAGTLLGVLASFVLIGQPVELLAVAVAISTGAVFLVADPTAASTTPLGRWLYGVLAGVLIVVFSPAGSITAEAVVAAALLASVFAPLIDHGAVLLHMRRLGRHG